MAVKTIGYLATNGKVYKRKGTATNASSITNAQVEQKQLNKQRNQLARKGWKVTKL